MAEHPPEIYDDIDALLFSAHFTPDAAYKENLRSHLRTSLGARRRSRLPLGRMRAWIFSYPNGYHAYEEQDETMNKSKLLTAFSVGILVLALAVFVGLVIVLPSLESPGEASQPSTLSQGSATTEILPAVTSNGDSAPTEAASPAGGSDVAVSPLFPSLNLVPITAENAALLTEVVPPSKLLSLILGLEFAPTQDVLLATTEAEVILWDMDAQDTLGGAGPGRGFVEKSALSPNGSILAMTALDYITVYDLTTGEIIQGLEGNTRYPFCDVAFTAGGSQVVTGSGDTLSFRDNRGYLTLWDLQSGEKLLTAGHDRAVKLVALNSDGSMIASGSTDGIIRLWNPNLEPLAELGMHGSMTELEFSPDGSLLASSGADANIRLWDVVNTTERMVLEGHSQTVAGIAFSPDGSLLASVGQDGTLRLWDVSTGQPLAVFVISKNGDGEPGFVAAGSDAAQASATDSSETWLTAVAFSPDGTVLVVGSGVTEGQLHFLGIPPAS